MKSFAEISKMNLADIDRPESTESDYEEISDSVAEAADGQDGEINSSGVKRRVVTVADAEGSPGEESDVVTVADAEGTSGEESDVVTVADVEGTDDAENVSGSTKKEHMRDPEGRNYYVNAKIGEKEMIAFLFAHNYRQPIMVIAVIVAIIWPIMTIVRQDGSLWYAIVIIVVVFLALPYSTWSRGKRAIKDNPAYENTFYYMLDEWGLHLELGDGAVDQEWSKINKCMFLKSVTVLYTGKNNAFLIPVESMGSRTEEINAFIKENKAKMK